jgi:16S rRNA (guanine527-N7)-methyltransferase
MSLGFDDGLKAAGLAPHESAAMQYFLGELLRWNRVHNLTAIDESEAAFHLHLIDSIIILPILQRYFQAPLRTSEAPIQIADLGSGGGLPGIPLAILQPTWLFSLIESSKKKAAFLQHVRGGLGLSHVQVMASRVENVAKTHRAFFDAITARAFTRLHKLLDLSAPLLKSSGFVFAMKSQQSEEEISEVSSKDWTLLEECELSLPGQALDRRLLVFQYQQ